MALERTLVMVKYEEKRKSHCTAPDKMLLLCVEIIIVDSSGTALGQLKKEEEERRKERRKSDFRPSLPDPQHAREGLVHFTLHSCSAQSANMG